MADTTGRPSLIPPLAPYRNDFARAETDTFRCHYAPVLHTYQIDIEKSAVAVSPQEVDRNIYAAAQECATNAFLQRQQSTEGSCAHTALLNSISIYVPHMGMPHLPREAYPSPPRAR